MNDRFYVAHNPGKAIMNPHEKDALDVEEIEIREAYVKDFHWHMQRAINDHVKEYSMRPKFILLNRELYGAFMLTMRRANPHSSSIHAENGYLKYDGCIVLCDPEQEPSVRALPDPEFAFSNLFDTSWKRLMTKLAQAEERGHEYFLQNCEYVEKIEELEESKRNLYDKYEALQKEVKRLHQKGIIVGISLTAAFILLELFVFK